MNFITVRLLLDRADIDHNALGGHDHDFSGKPLRKTLRMTLRCKDFNKTRDKESWSVHLLRVWRMKRHEIV